MKRSTLTFAQITEVAAKQQAYEASYSIGGLRSAIKDTATKLDTASLSIEWAKYLIAISESEVEHKDYHYELLAQHSINWSKVVVATIEELVTKHSYLEHRLLGFKLGKKLCNRIITIGTLRLKSSDSTKASLGSNIVQFLKEQGLLQNKIIKSITSHTHNIIEPSIKLQSFLTEEGLYLKASTVRSGGAAYRLINHTIENKGGNYLNSKSMLSGDTVQSISALDALNKQQAIPYMLVPDDKLIELLAEYRTQDKWFDKDGVFMAKEWNKLIEDLHRFKGETFHIPYAFETTSGRMHSCSSYINPQGSGLQKAMLTINGEKINKFDCRNNNVQVYALMGSDPLSAGVVGLTPIELQDIRVGLASNLNKYVGVPNTFTKATVKHLVMIALYGGMEKQLLDNKDTIKDDERYAGQYTIRDLVPEELKAGLYKFITDYLESVIPAALKLMNLIYRFNNENQSHYEWTMPDGFVVSYDVMETVTHKGYYLDLSQGKSHSVSIEAKVPNNTKYNRSLAPNIVRAVESYIAREVVRRADFHISLIHDSYGITTGNEDKLFTLIKEVMADVNDMDLLDSILRQIDPTMEFRITKGSLSRDDIMGGTPLSFED